MIVIDILMDQTYQKFLAVLLEDNSYNILFCNTRLP
jgi:hypothetical protein